MARPRGEGKEAKNITCPYLKSNQSMKLTREIRLVSIDNLDQDHRLHTKKLPSPLSSLMERNCPL